MAQALILAAEHSESAKLAVGLVALGVLAAAALWWAHR